MGPGSHPGKTIPMDHRTNSTPVHRLPQGFKNSPTLFDEVLHRDLVPFRKFHPDLILLQYVDDLLLAARTPKECTQGFQEHQEAFETIKRALLSAPALGLPDLTKPFELFVDEKQGFAKGMLTQRLGPWRRPTAYLSKKLDPVAAGWPPCLRMVAAIAVLVKDVGKLTLGQPFTVIAPHAVESIVKQPPDRCLSNAHMTHNQALLLDMDRVQFGPANSLNPAGARSPGPARLSANIGGNVWNSTGPDRSVTRGS
ncbi:hypothetical protein STEG23_019108 [Scotinomys teguina]